ncbi:membrane protein [Azospira sp. I13]|uniref:VTT domain-containing protein n=1 Tax=Azospira sp. I13 TaxID=1765050 RepID=UPI000D44532C|nr:VTT domain-containing protein [Azospira sp. I13]GBG02440.1 membrane protein [Azospira sp. I13]
MDLAQLTDALQRDAAWVVFFNVLMQQVGLPVPAVPTLLVAGSLAASPGQLGQILAAAVLASVIADWLWYLAGRAFGYRVLAGLCRLSINPGSCVSATEARFTRWGAWSLVVAKFAPGFSTVAPPIAGALRMALAAFLAAAAMGAALWAGGAIAAGWWLRDELQQALARLEGNGGTALALVALALGLWLGWKFWQKYRFEKLAAIPHITPAELAAALASAQPPLFLDLRGEAMIRATGLLPGATAATLEAVAQIAADWPREQLVVTLCNCPRDASAIQAARQLTALGYRQARPLRGGYQAWQAHGAVPAHPTPQHCSCPKENP